MPIPIVSRTGWEKRLRFRSKKPSIGLTIPVLTWFVGSRGVPPRCFDSDAAILALSYVCPRIAEEVFILPLIRNLHFGLPASGSIHGSERSEERRVGKQSRSGSSPH